MKSLYKNNRYQSFRAERPLGVCPTLGSSNLSSKAILATLYLHCIQSSDGTNTYKTHHLNLPNVSVATITGLYTNYSTNESLCCYVFLLSMFFYDLFYCSTNIISISTSLYVQGSGHWFRNTFISLFIHFKLRNLSMADICDHTDFW